jgi:hypothetical protein
MSPGDLEPVADISSIVFFKLVAECEHPLALSFTDWHMCISYRAMNGQKKSPWCECKSVITSFDRGEVVDLSCRAAVVRNEKGPRISNPLQALTNVAERRSTFGSRSEPRLTLEA